jgi:hypothetical protein
MIYSHSVEVLKLLVIWLFFQNSHSWTIKGKKSLTTAKLVMGNSETTRNGLEQWFSTGAIWPPQAAMLYFWRATGKSRKIGAMETVKWATKSSPLK